MRFVIQVVSEAKVTIDQETVGEIGPGLLVLAGIAGTDTRALADQMLKKMLALRIFPDESGKTNLSVRDVGGSILFVSQFTLYADCRRGNRPGFTHAGDPAMAEPLYEYMKEKIAREGIPVESGRFGAEMQVSLVNEGPFTVVLDSKELFEDKARR